MAGRQRTRRWDRYGESRRTRRATFSPLDLIFALRAVTNVPGFRPPSCSDRYDAMDSFPADTSTARGGDTQLTTLDLIATLRRVTNVDPSRPRRVSRGPCAAPES